MSDHASVERGASRTGTIDALSQRLELESLLTSLTTVFLEHPAHEVGRAIDVALSRIGDFTRADRAFLYLLNDERGTVEVAARWCERTADPVVSPSAIAQEALPELLGTLRAFEAVYRPDLTSPGDDLAFEWARLEPEPTAALLAVPMVEAGRLVGFTGLSMADDERMWSDGQITVLASLAGIVVQALARTDAERRFGLAFDAAPLGMALHAPDGRHLQVNAAYGRLAGRSPEELLDLRLFDVVHPEHHREIERAHREVLKGRSDLLALEVRMARAHEPEVWVRINASAVRAPDRSLRYTVGHFEDITERRRHEEELAVSEERFRTLVENSPAVIIRIDRAFQVVYISPIVEELVGVRPDDLIGSDELLRSSTEGQRWRRQIESVFRTGRPIEREWAVHFGDREVWFQSRAVPERDADGAVGHVLVVNNDITAIKRSEAELAHQALHDPLTGLANRALLLDHLGGALVRGARTPGSVGVLFLDLDRFKVVNDSLGHGAGDELLVEVARRLDHVVRPIDTVARLGGDEFVLLLEGLHDPREPLEVAERLRQALSVPVAVAGGEVYVTASIGIITSVDPAADPEGLLRDADAAMYLAKARGRDRIEVFDEVLRTEATERLHLENALRRSLDVGELVVHYQPEVDIGTGRIVGAEALARWHHPVRGLLEAGAFIALAEETGLIVDIGGFVLGEACRQFGAWKRSRPEPLVVRVNLAARQLSQPDLLDQVVAAIDAGGLEPRDLCLEITETALMDDPEWGLATLARLHDLGVRLAIDDFGTGYSSLAYLKQFPVDIVKVDQSFVQGLGVDPGDEAIVRAVVAMSDALGLDVVAEGVETVDQLEALRAMGVCRVQGYLFSRAVPPEDLLALLPALDLPDAERRGDPVG
ncbi:MAG: EAL domain-containing protein [Acidimicrobiales bacterium]|nr:EAL domain-containing protein [Acidimicrobiales bacterium]